MRSEQTNGIVELISRPQGHFREPSAVEANCPGTKLSAFGIANN